jgi:hypothetical protein
MHLGDGILPPSFDGEILMLEIMMVLCTLIATGGFTVAALAYGGGKLGMRIRIVLGVFGTVLLLAVAW